MKNQYFSLTNNGFLYPGPRGLGDFASRDDKEIVFSRGYAKYLFPVARRENNISHTLPSRGSKIDFVQEYGI